MPNADSQVKMLEKELKKYNYKCAHDQIVEKSTVNMRGGKRCFYFKTFRMQIFMHLFLI